MEPQTKKFHFQEVNWTISFPLDGNGGKYRGYTVWLTVGAGEAEQKRLGDLMDRPEIDSHYPHTVGYYKACVDGKPMYLEFREVRSQEEFWAFLNSVDL